MVREGARLVLLGLVVLLVLLLAWSTLSGAVGQLPRCRTVGQLIETGVQLLCGVLSVLVVVTSVDSRPWRRPVRIGWALSLATATGLSGLVWGPPMPLVALLLALGSGLGAWAVLRVLDSAAG